MCKNIKKYKKWNFLLFTIFFRIFLHPHMHYIIRGASFNQFQLHIQNAHKDITASKNPSQFIQICNSYKIKKYNKRCRTSINMNFLEKLAIVASLKFYVPFHNFHDFRSLSSYTRPFSSSFFIHRWIYIFSQCSSRRYLHRL